MPIVTLARLAMATRFEIVLSGEDPVALRAAGEEALQEVERLHRQLSLYQSESEISQLNARAAREPVRVSPELFRLLQHAKQLSEESGGAFDITVAPLLRCWGFMTGDGRLPDPRELERCRSLAGMHRVELNPAGHTVRFEREGVMLDLGAIGKGYAVEKAAEVLRDAGVTSALVHGGTSTIYALGRPADAEGWKLVVATQPEAAGNALVRRRDPAESREDNAPDPPLVVVLRDEALSVSAVWGKFFRAEGRIYGHVLDPRTGRPTAGTQLAAVALPSATETDALSTALLVLGEEGHDRIHRLRPGMRSLVLSESNAGVRLKAKGFGADIPAC